MSWSVNLIGRAEKLATVVKQKFEETQGCPQGSAEEVAKNEIGAACETLCKSLDGNPFVRIEANGSAWNEAGRAKSQQASFKLETIYANVIE